ncbi:MAG: hypothetical protein ABIE70_00145 [bacterium]
MDCYFGSFDLPEDNALDKSAVVAFHIPTAGIRFKAPFAAADTFHSNLASLLALLEFIDSNQKYFSNHTYQIYGNDLQVVNAVNRRQEVSPIFLPLLQKAVEYRQKYRFSLEWVAGRDNPLYDDLLD